MSAYPQAYIDYLVYFHAERDYFECHEVMEEYWKEHPGDPLASNYVGLIQIAVALYHHRRNNLTGAKKMLASSLNNLTDTGMNSLGIHSEELRTRIAARLEQLSQPDSVYEDMNLPLSDPRLAAACMAECAQKGKTWLGSIDTSDTFLIHKHRLRDRSSVLHEREQSRLRKAEQRGMEP
ncbi:DUF309 domain-containing protein [Paenibacillus sp. NPDC056579]|uniref:DUF309 domain-containing protein n=1 Tax=Paenibacillus sp. NPDC056579 TaxID=3345871 RepID=UPI0036835C9E